MQEPAREQLKGLAADDGSRALGLTLRGLVHELRNSINPMGLQLAILRRRVSTPSEELHEVLGGLRESIARAHETLDLASRLADEIAPHHKDDEDDRRLWNQLFASAREPSGGSASGNEISKVVPTPGSDS